MNTKDKEKDKDEGHKKAIQIIKKLEDQNKAFKKLLKKLEKPKSKK